MHGLAAEGRLAALKLSENVQTADNIRLLVPATLLATKPSQTPGYIGEPPAFSRLVAGRVESGMVDSHRPAAADQQVPCTDWAVGHGTRRPADLAIDVGQAAWTTRI